MDAHFWPRWERRRLLSDKDRRHSFARLLLEELEDRLAPATTFAVIGDYGNGGSGEAAVAALVDSWSPDFIVTTGDNNYSEGAAATIDAHIGQFYSNYIYPYVGIYGSTATTNQFFPALGNHDWNSTAGYGPYLDYFTLPGNERYYSFVWGNVEIFVVNSDSHEPDGRTATSVQAAWLQEALAASTTRWQIITFHHAPYTSGTVHAGNTDLRWPFKEWGADAVLSGHQHNYERLLIGGLPYFVDGLGGVSRYPFGPPVSGSQLRYNGDYGAMLVTADETKINFQFINVDGVVIDSYTITKPVLPRVTIKATDASAAEEGLDGGLLTITRTGSTATELVVNYTLLGSAKNGVDYDALAGTATIPAGSSSVTFSINPVDDALGEGEENVNVTLAFSPAYNVGAARTGVIKLADNDAEWIVRARSTWKFLDDGSNQGTAWRQTDFNDSTWLSGKAQLGYGDGDEATIVSYGPNLNNKYTTTYFRLAFAVTDPAQYGDLILSLLRDDGAVIYLNGTEIGRSNMPAGPITSTTLASSGVSDAAEAKFFKFTVDPNLLVSGTNVLAVEVHQIDPMSSDISFDLKLLGAYAN